MLYRTTSIFLYQIHIVSFLLARLFDKHAAGYCFVFLDKNVLVHGYKVSIIVGESFLIFFYCYYQFIQILTLFCCDLQISLIAFIKLQRNKKITSALFPRSGVLTFVMVLFSFQPVQLRIEIMKAGQQRQVSC